MGRRWPNSQFVIVFLPRFWFLTGNLFNSKKLEKHKKIWKFVKVCLQFIINTYNSWLFQIFGWFLTLELTILLQQRGYKVAHEYFSKIQDLQIQIRNSCGRIMWLLCALLDLFCIYCKNRGKTIWNRPEMTSFPVWGRRAEPLSHIR